MDKRIACAVVTCILSTVILSAGTDPSQNQEGLAEKPPPQQYLIVLHSTKDPMKPELWTPEDENLVSEHFQHLTSLLDKGILVLAGRTLDAESMGLVVLDGVCREEAEKIMNADPAVRAGLFKAELHPYRVALLKSSTSP